VVNAATVSTTFLLVVLVVAATSRLWVALTVSAAAVLCFNFFFLPPLGTFVVAEPQNWLALISFFAVSLVASNLSAVARARTAEALGRRDEQARLFDLSRDVLVLPDSRAALTTLARAVSRRFDLEYLAIALPAGDTWEISAGAEDVTLDPKQPLRRCRRADHPRVRRLLAHLCRAPRTHRRRPRHPPGATARGHAPPSG
jgi:two-component system sensor histidine kinase KdpD